MKSTRGLRLWHWRVAMHERSAARDRRCSEYTRKKHNAKADFHIKCVQVLNDCPDCAATTAGMDDGLGFKEQ